MIELKKLSVDDGYDVYAMLQTIPREENGLYNSANGLSYEEFRDWLVRKDGDSRQEGLKDGWRVPSSTYWLYVDEDPVGYGTLRHFLTESLRKEGGNIGYGIAPAYRGKGYGKMLLRSLLAKAKEKGIDRVLITVQTGNEASKKVALANGGIIEEVSNERYYIWIDTKDS